MSKLLSVQRHLDKGIGYLKKSAEEYEACTKQA